MRWLAAEKARAGLRHAVVCPNVTERTKESCFARHSWLAASGANLYPPGGCRAVFLWRYVTRVSFCFVFVFFAFTEAAVLRSIVFVLIYACAPIATRNYLTTICIFFLFCFFLFFFLFSLEVSLFPSIFIPLPFLFVCMYVSMYVWSSHIAEYGSTG